MRIPLQALQRKWDGFYGFVHNDCHTWIASHITPKADLVLVTIFSPLEQFHFQTQFSILLNSFITLPDGHPSPNWPRPIRDLDQSDSSCLGLAIRDFLIQYSRILRRSGKLGPLSVLGHSANVKSRAKPDLGYRITGHESDGENVINLFP